MKKSEPPAPNKPLPESMVIKKARENLETAVKTGRWITIAVRIENRMIKFEREVDNFPLVDLTEVERLLIEDLKKIT